MVNQNSARSLDEETKVVVISPPISMHTGQIIMLTKIMTSDDLRFYEFDTGTPVQRWCSDPSGSFEWPELNQSFVVLLNVLRID